MSFSSFIFKDNHVFNEEDTPSQKVAIAKEELNDTDIDDIRNLEDLLRFVFIDEQFGNLQEVADGGELSRNINQKKKSDVLQAYR